MTETVEPPKTPVDQFIDAVWKATQAHPFLRDQRIVNNKAIVKVRPDVDDRDRRAHISDIISLTPGVGDGRAALQFLLDLADQHGVTLTLFPKAYFKGAHAKGRLKTKDLIAWYSRHGFRRTRDREMIRPPQAAAVQEAAPPEYLGPDDDEDDDGPYDRENKIKLLIQYAFAKIGIAVAEDGIYYDEANSREAAVTLEDTEADLTVLMKLLETGMAEHYKIVAGRLELRVEFHVTPSLDAAV